MIYFLVLSVLINLVLFFIIWKQNNDRKMLIKLNDSLDTQITNYKVSQSNLLDN